MAANNTLRCEPLALHKCTSPFTTRVYTCVSTIFNSNIRKTAQQVSVGAAAIAPADTLRNCNESEHFLCISRLRRERRAELICEENANLPTQTHLLTCAAAARERLAGRAILLICGPEPLELAASAALTCASRYMRILLSSRLIIANVRFFFALVLVYCGRAVREATLGPQCAGKKKGEHEREHEREPDPPQMIQKEGVTGVNQFHS